MTENSQTDKFTWKTPVWFWPALLMIVVFAAVMIVVTTDNDTQPEQQSETIQFDPTPSYFDERDQYEQVLLDHPDRRDDTFSTYIDSDGLLYYRGDTTAGDGRCEYRCLVATEVEDGIAITVPVSFNYIRHSGDVPPLTNIVELTYWDPVDHAPKTVRADKGETIQIPDVLRYDQTVADMQVGDAAYTGVSAVRLSDTGVIVLDIATLLTEPNCSYDNGIGDVCGWAERAQIQRTEEGFAVCIPEWVEGEGVSRSLPGIDNAAARKLLYVSDATGLPVHTLQVC